MAVNEPGLGLICRWQGREGYWRQSQTDGDSALPGRVEVPLVRKPGPVGNGWCRNGLKLSSGRDFPPVLLSVVLRAPTFKPP